VPLCHHHVQGQGFSPGTLGTYRFANGPVGGPLFSEWGESEPAWGNWLLCGGSYAVKAEPVAASCPLLRHLREGGHCASAIFTANRGGH
jgi:hypothetical protein